MEIILNTNILDFLTVAAIVFVCIFIFRDLVDDIKYLINPKTYFSRRIQDLGRRYTYNLEKHRQLHGGKTNKVYSFANAVVLIFRLFILSLLVFEVCRITGWL